MTTVGQVNHRRPLKAGSPKRFDKTRKKIYRNLIRLGWGPALYWAEARTLSWFCRQSWVQRYYWPAKVALIHRFLNVTGILKLNQALNINQTVQLTLLGDCLLKRWHPRHSHFSPDQLATIITVHGQEIFTTAYQQRHGVILVHYHTAVSYLIHAWLQTTGATPIQKIVRGPVASGKREGTDVGVTDQFFHVKQLYEAKTCLQQGGIVFLLADGRQGGGGISFPFFGYNRTFRTAFAELALLTGATVVPLSSGLNEQGVIELTFHSPLDRGEPTQPNQVRIEQLVGQYVAFLHTQWVSRPSSLTLSYMETQLNKKSSSSLGQ